MNANTTLEHLTDKFTMGDDCWEWTAGKSVQGYGRVSFGGKNKLAHRVVYELMVGPIPKNLEIDHLCRNRGCVRPDHLEPVLHAINVSRGDARAGVERGSYQSRNTNIR